MSSGANKAPKHNDFAPPWLKVHDGLPQCTRPTSEIRNRDENNKRECYTVVSSNVLFSSPENRWREPARRQKSFDNKKEVSQNSQPRHHSTSLDDSINQTNRKLSVSRSNKFSKRTNGIEYDPRPVTSITRSRSARPACQNIENPSLEIEDRPEVDVLQKPSLDEEFPSLSLDDKTGASVTSTLPVLIKPSGVWEKPLKTDKSPSSSKSKEVENKPTMYKASLSNKNRARLPLQSDNIAPPYSSTVDIPPKLKPTTSTTENGVKNEREATEARLSNSLEKEKKLLRDMGWTEDENGEEYIITEEDKKEFEMRCKNLYSRSRNGQTNNVSEHAIVNALRRLRNSSSSSASS
ncbi:DgyrCDS995 [Dimorphilus gyrociliatus]|uniref:DgyrCDS995 n=1 Tax=Dimorphilus gyrociliatus TaxID=2664684 RepID=A0A7I8V5X6_9ANNE|nr:DgyrCDS995 [Dimorphilus gyrociliatus]